MSTQYLELTASKCEDESLCDAVERQKEYWSKDIPNAMRELISALMEYLSSEPKQNKRLFILNLSECFCKDPSKFFQLSGKSFVPFNLLEELLNQFCRNANCEIRVNKVPDIAYAVVPKLDTILETKYINKGCGSDE